MNEIDRPTWQDYREHATNDAAAAMAVLEVEPTWRLANSAAQHLAYSHYGHPVLDWKAWAEQIATFGPGWSSTEWRLFDLAAAIAAEQPVSLAGTLDELSDWAEPVLAIIVDWASGGNMRGKTGRVGTVVLEPLPDWPFE